MGTTQTTEIDEATRLLNEAQNALEKHRSYHGCRKCWWACNPRDYCEEGRKLRKRRDDMMDRYYEAARRART